MRVLIAEDNTISRLALEDRLRDWGYEVVAAAGGSEAWEVLESPDPPSLMILDWIMPGMDGIDICRRVRHIPGLNIAYILLLTGKDRKEDIIMGLKAGADDYITKPFNYEELRVRLQVGERVLDLQSALATQIRELKEALSHIKTLQSILPICSYCKRVRNDRSYWQQLDSYLREYADVQFSHGICPECQEKHVMPQFKDVTIIVPGKTDKTDE